MMKRSLLLGMLLCTMAAPVLAAPSSCEKVRADIQQKIINNGVPESGFSLTIVPNDEVDQSGANSVVGHCSNDNWFFIGIIPSSRYFSRTLITNLSE